MKNTIKKIILVGALAVLAVVFVSENPIRFGLCKNIAMWDNGTKYCVGGSLLPEYIRQLGGFLSFSLLFLVLITYKMRDEVFRAWWNFARWWVLVIILVTYLQSTQSGGGGLGIGGAMSSGFDMLILGFFYVVLVVVSLWRIVRKYRQLKREGK